MTRVVTWSAKESGLTSFLAALWPAIHHPHHPELAGAAIHCGDDEGTWNFLNGQGGRLLQPARLPFPDGVDHDRNLSFQLRVPPALTRPVDVEIVDPGIRPVGLAETRGLGAHVHHLYLHDPTNIDANVPVVDLMINTLARQNTDGDPYRLAVCVTKFDDPSVFVPAREEERLCPRRRKLVAGHPLPCKPKDFFARFAVPYIEDRIHKYFRSDKTRYFACSAVGLRRTVGGHVDVHDFVNVKRIGGRLELLQPSRPINVVRPLRWLLTNR